MRALLKGYFYVNKTTFAWLFAIILMMYLFSVIGGRLVVPPNFYLAWMIISAFIRTDEKYKTEILFRSLPIASSLMVGSRYLWILGGAVMVEPVSIVSGVIFKILPLNVLVPDSLFSVHGFITTLIPLLIYFSVALPLHHMFNYTISTIAGITGLTVFFFLLNKGFSAIVPAAVKPATAIPVQYNKHFPNMMDMMFSPAARAWFGETNFLVAIGIITILLMAVSFRLSVKFYTWKEL
ncbi:MAG: hypothetical protein GY940_08095 [bacterium]|nr:hypothetical protein [bacterium]